MGGGKFERHVPYFVVLEAFQASGGCALCDLELDSMRHYFESVLYESVNDPKLRADLRKSHGYCHRHAHQLRSFNDALAVAILCRDQISQFLSSPEEPHGWSLGALFHHHPAPSDTPVRCPACVAQAATRARHVDVLLDSLHSDPEMRTTFKASPGLCVPHFHAVLAAPNLAVDVRRQVVNVIAGKFTALLAELEELCAKYDYQRLAEKPGGEADSWIRAVEMTVGRKDVF